MDTKQYRQSQKGQPDTVVLVTEDRVMLLITKFQAAALSKLLNDNSDLSVLRDLVAKRLGVDEKKYRGQLSQLRAALTQLHAKNFEVYHMRIVDTGDNEIALILTREELVEIVGAWGSTNLTNRQSVVSRHFDYENKKYDELLKLAKEAWANRPDK